MNKKTPLITPTTYALIAGLAALLITSLSDALIGIHPYVNADRVDYTGLAVYLSVTFLPSLGISLLSFFTAHKQQIVQATEEEAVAFHLPQEVVTLLNDVRMLMQFNVAQKPAQPPTTMTVNVHPASPLVATVQQSSDTPPTSNTNASQTVSPLLDASVQTTVPQQQLVFSGVATTDDTQPRAAVQVK